MIDTHQRNYFLGYYSTLIENWMKDRFNNNRNNTSAIRISKLLTTTEFWPQRSLVTA